MRNHVFSRAIIEQDESSANSHLGSLSGPSEEAQGSSLVPDAVALTPDKATATATANSTAATTTTTTTTSGKAAQLSVAKVS